MTSLLRTEKTVKLSPQVFVSDSKPEAGKIHKVTERHFWKPFGGLWTSTLDEVGGQWLRWLNDNDYFGTKRWGGKLWLLEPKEANLFVVWSPKEYRELTERFPHEMVSQEVVAHIGPFVDWPALSEFYDGIYVPSPWTWRFGHEDMAAAMFFYGMDAECTCWFRWRFQGIPQEIDPAPYLAKLSDHEA